MKKTGKLLAFTLLAGLGSGLAFADSQLTVDDAWIREAPPGATALAGYLSLHNQGDTKRMVVGASSPAFANAMLHRTVMEDGMAKMFHQHLIEVPAGESVTFEPNDYHIMLMKPVHPLKAGDLVDVTLEFKNGEKLRVEHVVRGGASGMDHGSMNHSQMSH